MTCEQRPTGVRSLQRPPHLQRVDAGDTPATTSASLAVTIAVRFSKGLGCPGGAVLVGPQDLIARAGEHKRWFGGSMRQAGILAAAGVHALEHDVERLAEDHRSARRLAYGPAGVPGLCVNVAGVETNMVYFTLGGGAGDLDAFHAACPDRGLRFGKQVGTGCAP